MTLEHSNASMYVPQFVADGERIPVSSRGLGWSGLKFERRESTYGSRHRPDGSRHHLIFLGLSNGQVVRESNGERITHEITPGCVLIIPARTPTRWNWRSPIGYSVLALEPALLDRVAREAFGLEPDQYQLPICERRNDTAIASVAGTLARESLSRDRAGNLHSEALGNILSVHLLRSYATAQDGSPLVAARPADESRSNVAPNMQSRAVAEALQFIHDNYASDVALGDIAAAAHLSPSQLTRLIKQALGVSPYQHVIEVRVNNARHLLSAGSGQRSLAEIASAVGFADQSHLTRHFKRLTGVTPSRFRDLSYRS